jgi:predicted component of type VI protein secretion system
MRTIYCLELENDKFFLFSRSIQSINPIELFLEAVLTYKYTQQNKPLGIKEVCTETHPLDLDHHVKKYMLDYGIDRVRGGSYSEPILTPEQLALLTVELQGPITPFPPEVTKEIIDKYSRVLWDNEDFKKERTRLLSEQSRFQCESAVLAQMRQLDLPKVRADLDWLLNYCEMLSGNIYPTHGRWSSVLNQLIIRYRQMLPNLRDIYSFMTLSGRPFDTYGMVPLQYPQFLLDKFFYGIPRPRGSDREHVRQLCEAYQTFVITWENRLAEAEFDVESWGPHADERFLCALTVMDLSIPKSD